MKKLLHTIALLLFPTISSADSGVKFYRYYATEIDGIYYFFNSSDKTASVSYKYKEEGIQITEDWGEEHEFSIPPTWFSDYSGDVVIPKEVVYYDETYSVTSIGENAFINCSGLTSITIPNSVTSIGSGAFYGTAWYNNQPNGILYLDNCLLGYKGDTMPSGVLEIKEGTRLVAGGAFFSCSGLTSVSIPNSVTSIGDYAFYGCSGLTSINIPNEVTSIGDYAFADCKDMTTVTIPHSVTSIGEYAFFFCEGLTTVTSLNPIPPLSSSSFSNQKNITLYVPKGCKDVYSQSPYWKNFENIIEFKIGDSNVDNIINSKDVDEVANYIMGNPSDKFVFGAADANQDGKVNVIDIVTIMNNGEYDNNGNGDVADRYLTFVAQESGTFKFSGTTGNDHIGYSMDGGKTWNTLASGVDSPTVSAGNRIMWKGLFSPYSTAGIGKFSSTGIFDVEGNIMSLLYGDDFKDRTSLSGKDYVFDGLFSGCTRLTSAENLVLPAMTLANFCYRSMFHSCTSFKKAPKLPAKTMSDWCYGLMFEGCTSLTIAPSLPANKLGESCYSYMFNGCTSLTTAPSQPCTKLAWSCYNYMFSGCTSLKTAPDLPATTLVRNCYRGMFSGCTSLNYIKCLATSISAQNCTKDRVKGVASTGTFIKASYMTSWTTGNDGIPSGWTVYNE